MVAVLEKLELSQLEECFSDVAPLSIPHWFINAGVIHLYSTLAIYKPFAHHLNIPNDSTHN